MVTSQSQAIWQTFRGHSRAWHHLERLPGRHPGSVSIHSSVSFSNQVFSMMAFEADLAAFPNNIPFFPGLLPRSVGIRGTVGFSNDIFAMEASQCDFGAMILGHESLPC